MRFLPLGLDLHDRPCLVVGGGVIGTRKALALARAGADVTVVAPAVTAELDDAVRAGRIRRVEAAFRPEHLDGALLTVIATDDPATNERAAAEARERGLLLCDATSGERSDVIFGALYEEDGVTVATFTDGRDPGRARRVRDRIARWLARPPVADGEEGVVGLAAERPEPVLLLVAHGSRNPDWVAPLETLVQTLRDRVGQDRVRLAHAQFSAPTLEEAVGEIARSGRRLIRVLPLFMTAAGHVERDIRPAVEALRRAHENVEIELLPPVGELPSFRILLAELAREVTR